MLKTEHYCITSENILSHEFIGLETRVYSKDKNKQKINGKVVDETKNLMLIEKNGEIKKIPKKEAMFEFKIGKKTVKVDGKKILFKPEQRLKVLWRKQNEWRKKSRQQTRS